MTSTWSRDEPRFLIWSIEHTAWWRPKEMGYTPHVNEAGAYATEDALRIIQRANVVRVNETLVPVAMARPTLTDVECNRLGANPHVQRLYDLVRYKRHDLHEDGLVTSAEYGALVHTGAVSARRLESYDELRTTMEAERHARRTEQNLLDLLTQSTSPCGHWSCYTMTPDGKGVEIVCLMCRLEAIRPKVQALQAAFDAFTIAEIKRHAGLPALPPEELELRVAIAELLDAAREPLATPTPRQEGGTASDPARTGHGTTTGC